MLTAKFDTKTVQEFLSLYKVRQLNLTPAFQRQSVWTRADRRLLVQSLYEGIPLPSVYLYAQMGKRGTPKYDVIDGKQRIETLLHFIGALNLDQVETPLSAKLDVAGAGPVWRCWNDLPTKDRHRLLTAPIPVIEVQGELGEIIDLFIRINSTGKRLAGQERRHAHFYASDTLKTAQRVADEIRPFLVKTGILTLGQVQRMKHVELATEILVAVSSGVHPNKKRKLDAVIQGELIDKVSLTVASKELLRSVRQTTVLLPDLAETRFARLADFYSLVVLLQRLRAEGKVINAHGSARNALAGELLFEFGHGVDRISDQVTKGAGSSQAEKRYLDYLQTVREGTDSAAQRIKRERILREVVAGVFEELDAKRLFNPTQRRILWNHDPDHLCAICDRRIQRFADMHVDHIAPYIRGGSTDLANGAVTHKACNLSKGAD